MTARLGGLVFALLFAIPFGGVGAGAAWVLGQNLMDWHRAKDWVATQATVEAEGLTTSQGRKGGATFRATGTYSYTLDGQRHQSTRLGLDRLQGSDNLGDWQHEMAAYLAEARREKRPITVYVNPDKPEEAVVDRDPRWGWLGFVTIFAVLFGGVGLGALVAAGYALFGSSKEKRVEREVKDKATARAARRGASNAPIACDASSGLGVFWGFTIFWNLIAFGAAFLAVPQLIEQGQYGGLFVLLFPLFGLLLLWGAISTTLAARRRGPATLVLDPPHPKTGSAFSGVVRFAKAKAPGDRYDVSAKWSRKTFGGKNSRELASGATTATATVSPGAGGESRLAFRMEVPRGEPATDRDEDEMVRVDWRIEVERAADENKSPFSFPIEMTAGGAPAFAAQDAFAPASPPASQPGSHRSPQPEELKAAFLSVGKPGGEAQLQQLLAQAGVAQGRVINPDNLRTAVAAAGIVRKWAPRIGIAVAVVVGLQFLIGIVVAIVAMTS